ncbi:virulence-associated protein VagC [Inquilinus ginsengisoli]|uniref:antitoxin n=1 Tax=Inquilinus ginsengisoli TaxID=363840 RepID=UPI003D1AE52F
MSDTAIAKLFQTGHSQVVRLPKGFHLPGKEVRVRRYGRGVLLESMERSVVDIQTIVAEIARLRGIDFPPERRPEQPPMPAETCRWTIDRGSGIGSTAAGTSARSSSKSKNPPKTHSLLKQPPNLTEDETK